MLTLAATRDAEAARASLSKLVSLTPIDKRPFSTALRRFDRRFAVYADTCPVPLPAAGLIITPEIRRQCELHLPLAEIREMFYQLYRQALSYPPIFSSTPFHAAASWADLYASLSPTFQISANPAELLRHLLDDPGFLTAFLFESFLPSRFYGGFRRYPGQLRFIREWLANRCNRSLRFLDAACGTGEGSYDLAMLLSDLHWERNRFLIEGWTVEPLEVWAAAYFSFPHDPGREQSARQWTAALFDIGFTEQLRFSSIDLLEPPNTVRQEGFDLIICNGLLGGPIVNRPAELELVAENLAGLLAPGGILLVADSFHDGWKKKIPGEILGDLLKRQSLSVCAAGEGVAGVAHTKI